MKMQENGTDAVELENMVDQYGLGNVLEALVTICHGKAEHLRSNWQDPNTARVWERAARLIETPAGKVDL
jgi:hypothetical protein